MNLPRIAVLAGIFAALIFTASAITEEEFVKSLPVSDTESAADIESLISNTALNTPQISRDVKQNAINEVMRKFETQSTVPVIVWLKPGASPNSMVRNLKGFEVVHTYEALSGFAGTANRQAITSLLSNKKVDYIAFDAPVVAHLAESRPLIGANTVSTSYGLTGNGVGVCHLDSGVNYNHPALSGAYAGGYDFVNNDPDPMDDGGHGTITAGVIASSNSTFTGIAPGVDLLAVKVLDAANTGQFSDVAAGINWCITNKNQYNIGVISMSLGTITTVYTPQTSPVTIEPALQAAYNALIVPVVSSGNIGSTNGISYPAVSPFVTSVGSTHKANRSSMVFTSGNFTCTDTNIIVDMMSCFTNRAPFLDLVAPGSRITTSFMAGFFATSSGTSLATPHVAGTIALMKERNPQMTPDHIEEILKSTGVPVQDGATSLTFPRVNALGAVDAVPYITKTGTFFPGNTITINISDPVNAGELYMTLLSLSTSPGIPLPNGLVIPITPDGLFSFSLNPAPPIMINSIGFLDSNGRATVTINVPPIPGIEIFPVHAAFITGNGATATVYSTSNAIRL